MRLDETKPNSLNRSSSKLEQMILENIHSYVKHTTELNVTMYIRMVLNMIYTEICL